MLALAFLLISTSSDPMCARALSVAPDLSCAPATRGVALASSPAEAARLAAHAQAAEARFNTRFGLDAPAYVVVSTPPAPDRAAFNAAGFSHVLPWPAPRAFDEAARRSVADGARRFAVSQNMTSAQTEEVVARALSQIPDAAAQDALDAGMVPHELGHLWFTAAFWPQRADGDGDAPARHYGGPGPDWLDESAAVVMEDDATASMRRSQFRALMRNEIVSAIGPLEGRAILLDLSGLLSREHPGLSRAVAAAPDVAASGGIGVSFTPAGAGPRPGALERVFYIQTRVFSDYLIQTSGRPAILADIARGMARGLSFDAWLAENGPSNRLPSSVDALQEDWTRYAQGL